MAADGYRQRLALLDSDDRALAAGHGGLDQISGLHDEMLLRQRDHNGGLLRALRLVKLTESIFVRIVVWKAQGTPKCSGDPIIRPAAIRRPTGFLRGRFSDGPTSNRPVAAD